MRRMWMRCFFFFQAEDGIRDVAVTGVQTCALPISFSVFYEFVTGKSNWGPHSFYVALIVETGLVGSVVFLLFLRYLFLRLRAARALGRQLAVEGLAVARRVRPLAWGMTAALAGTMAANFFYLTMQFYYFYAFAVLVLALPIVFSRPMRP